MKRIPWRLWPLLAGATLLGGCGGGGGGGEDGSPAPPALQQLTIDAAQTDFYFGAAFDFSNITHFYSLLGLSAYGTFAQPGGLEPVTIACEGGGTLRVALEDRDHSGGISVNDRVTLTYEACGGASEPLDAVIRVVFTTIDVAGGGPIAIQAAATSANRLVYEVTLDSFTSRSADGTKLTVSGGIDVELSFDEQQDRFIVTTDRLATTLSGPPGTQTLTLRDFERHYTLDYDSLRYSLTLAGRIDVEAATVRGYYTFETPETLGGAQNNYPTSGQLTVHGAEGGYVRLEEGNDPFGTTDARADLHIATGSGNGESVGSLFWSAVLDPATLTPLRAGVDVPVNTGQPAPVSQLQARTVDLGATGADMAWDATRGVIYVSVPTRNEIAVISGTTYQVTERIRVGQRPTGIDLSADSATLYIANNADGSVDALELDNRTIAKIDVAGVLGNGRAFDVVEGAPGVLYVSGTSSGFGHYELMRIDRNAGDAIATIGVSAGSGAFGDLRLKMDSTRRYLYVTAVDGSELVRWDTSNLQLQPARGLLSQFDPDNPEFYPDGSRLIVSGRILDTDTLQIDETVPSLNARSARFSPDARYFWTTHDGATFDVYNVKAGLKVAVYGADCGGPFLGPFRTFMPVDSGGEWASLLDTKLCVFSPSSPQSPPGLPGEPAPQPPTVQAETSVLHFDSPIRDVAVDEAARLAYISLPDQDRIVVLDTTTGAIAATIPTPSRPAKLELSADRTTLYIAFDHPRSFGYLDTATHTVTRTLDLSEHFPFSIVKDIAAAGPDRLFLAGQSTPAALLQLTPSQNDALEGVESDTIRGAASLALNGDRTVLYVGDYDAPRRLYRFDLTQAQPTFLPQPANFDPPVDADMKLSADDARIYFTGGEVIDSTSFHPLARLGQTAEASVYPQRTANLVTAAEINFSSGSWLLQLVSYDATTFLPVRIIDTSCPANSNLKLRALDDETRWAVVAEYAVCLVTVP